MSAVDSSVSLSPLSPLLAHMPIRPRTVISGGQTGVDQAALRAALDCSLTIGGWCPPDRRCEGGIIPARFARALRETPTERSDRAPHVARSLRTEWNVREADATLILCRRSSSSSSSNSEDESATPLSQDRGTQWTIECAQFIYKRPFHIFDVRQLNAEERIRRWLADIEENILAETIVLNVAGPSEGSAPGIGDEAYELLFKVFSSK